MEKLTRKQRLFCEEYIKNPNATAAAKLAGYAQKYAHTNASKLLQNTTISEYIKKRMEEKDKELIADQNEILKYLTSVLRGEAKSEIVVIEAEKEGGSFARCMKKAPDEKERLKAAELLGKRYGLYTEKTDLSGAIPVVICGSDDLED